MDDRSPTAKELETAMRLDQVAELLSESGGQQQQQPQPQTQPQHQLPGCVGMSYHPAITAPAPCAMTMDPSMPMPMTMQQPDQSVSMANLPGLWDVNDFGTDWWQTDLGAFPQPVLSYEDLFGINQGSSAL